VIEGVDADGLPSMRAVEHVLHMAVKLRGNRPENFFTAHIPAASPFFAFLPSSTTPNPRYAPTTFFDQSIDGRFQDLVPIPNAAGYAGYKTQWAEVAYSLVPNGTSAGGTPLFALYRFEFKVVPDNRYINGTAYPVPPPPPLPPPPLVSSFNLASSPPAALPATWLSDGYQEMSCQLTPAPVPPYAAGTLLYYFNTPSDLAGSNGSVNRALTATLPGTAVLARGGFSTTTPGPEVWSATLIATDVVSFDVQVLSPELAQLYGTLDFNDIPNPNLLPNVAFDTATSTNYYIPAPNTNNYTIKAIKITLRVWDLKTRQTRQVTVIQDM
jgi:hypothetical protein